MTILPKISVIMNTFRERPEWLRAAIRSYKVQQQVDVQLIVSAVRGDPNIPLIESMGCEIVISDAPGVYQQLNNALPHIKGDWYCYASSNDMACDTKLREEYDRCFGHNKMVAYSSFYKCTVDLRPLTTHQAIPYDYQNHLKGNFVNDCALVHASLIAKYAPFRTQWKNHAYHDLWLRIYEGEGDVFINNPHPTWFYRGHDGLKLHRQRNQVLLKENRESRQRMLAWHKGRQMNAIIELLKEDLSGSVTDMSNNCDNEKVNEGVNEDITHFVYVYVASPARWNELSLSIQSIRRNFQGKAKFFCVGDPPGIKDVTHIPVTQIKGRGSKPKDAITKLKAICACELINEDFIYCYDDVILLKPITGNWFDKIIANEHVKDYTRHWEGAKGVIPDLGWRSLFLKTFAVLTKKRLPVYNYETHIPRRISKTKIQHTINQFSEVVSECLFNSLYFNLHYEKPDYLLKSNGISIKAGCHRPYDKQEKLIGEIKGKTWLNFNDGALNEMFKKTVTKIVKGEIKV